MTVEKKDLGAASISATAKLTIAMSPIGKTANGTKAALLPIMKSTFPSALAFFIIARRSSRASRHTPPKMAPLYVSAPI